MSQAPESESAQVLREVRALGRDLNDLKIAIARVEAAHTALTHRMDTSERHAERVAAKLADLDRFSAGAGVKFGGAQWGVALLIMTLVSIAVTMLTRQSQGAPRADTTEDRRGP